MNMDYLRCFLAVTEEMNLTRAAERLEMAQPHLKPLSRTRGRGTGLFLFVIAATNAGWLSPLLDKRF